MSNNENKKQNSNTFINTIKDYKELILICALFFSGVLLVFGYFATKQQLTDEHAATKIQIKEIQCLLNSNVDIIQGKIDYGSLSDLLVKNLNESKSLSDKKKLNAEDKAKLALLKIAADELGRKLAAADNANAEALKKLRYGACVVE